VIVGALGVVAVASGMRRRPAAAPEHEPVEPEVEELAA
jgi:hypothetical protein